MSSSDPLHLKFRRSGGIFAGNTLELEVDQSDLDEAETTALARVIEGPGPERFSELPSQGAGADEYQYDLTFERGGDALALRFDESRLPPELAPLVDALEKRAMSKSS